MGVKKSNFIVRGGADFSLIKKEMQKTITAMTGFKSAVDKDMKRLQVSMGGIVKKIAMIISTIFAGRYIKDSISELSKLQGALVGLSSVANGTGRSFTRAQKFIRDFTADGLIPAADAITAYKNLLARGYDDSQIQKVLTSLKDSAAFGRQAGLSYGDAIRSATEGLKNENSLLVDNSGVTKNVSKMWDDYAKSIGKTRNSLSQQEKIQAEVNGIMEETRFQMGDAARYANTYAGEAAGLSRAFLDLKIAVGGIAAPIAQVLIPYIKAAVQWITRLANTIGAMVQAVTGKGGFLGVTGDSDTVSESFENVGDSAIEAGNDVAAGAKKAKGALAGFDEINKISMSESGGGADTGGGIDPGGIGAIEDIGDVSLIEETAEGLNDRLKNLLEGLKSAAEPTVNSFNRLVDALKPLKDFAAKGLMDFWEHFLKPMGKWTLGVGIPALLDGLTRLAGAIDWSGINAAFERFWKVLQPFSEAIGEGLLDFYNMVLIPLAAWSANAFIRFLDILSNSLAALNMDKVNQAFRDLWEVLTPFAMKIGEGLLWFIENVLAPLAVWTVNDVLPVFLNILAGAIRVLNEAIEVLKPFAIWLWDNFLKPIAKWTGGVIVDVLEGIANALHKVSDWMGEHQTLVQGMTTSIALFFGAWKITEAMAFIQMSGGLIVALTKVITIIKATTTAIKAATIAKIADKLETMAIIGLYAKDFIVTLPKTIALLAQQTLQWLKLTAAKAAGKLETIQIIGLYAKDFVISVAKATAHLVSEAAQWVKLNAIKAAAVAKQAALTAATVAWNAVCGIAATVTTAFGAALAFLTSPVGLVIVGIGALIAIITLLVRNWDTVKEVAAKVWESVKATWKGAAAWFDETVVKPVGKYFTLIWESMKIGGSLAWDAIKNIFSTVPAWFKGTFKNAWQGVKDVFSTGGKIFSGIKDGIASTFKTVVNGLIDGINRIITVPFRSINGMLNKIRNIDVLGAKPFSGLWNTNPLTIPQIPKLAKGGVVAPNNEFLAILGDNKQETEVVSPLSTIKQALSEVMGQGGGLPEQNIIIEFTGDGADLAAMLMPKIIREANGLTKRRGATVFSV